MAAAPEVEELIREVAARHGVGLRADDPLLILHTINRKLVEDTAAAQGRALAEFQRELEAAMTRLGVDSTDKAERAIGAAVRAARDTLTAQTEEVARRTSAQIDAAGGKAAGAVTAAINAVRPLVLLAIGAAGLSVLAAVVVVVFTLKG